jgi:sialate O-acetylesterase
MEVNYLPEDTNWAKLREAQRKALEVPHTAMVVTLNLGEWNDIHPGNKKPIGDRMALAAQRLAYSEDIVYSGPLYSSFTVNKNKVVLHFKHRGSGLISNDGEPLRWFAISGEDQNFIWAHAEIQDDRVVVWHEDIKNPFFIRYAWADNPDKVNLFNLEGLPASPFEVKLK